MLTIILNEQAVSDRHRNIFTILQLRLTDSSLIQLIHLQRSETRENIYWTTYHIPMAKTKLLVYYGSTSWRKQQKKHKWHSAKLLQQKAGTVVLTAISKHPNALDNELKQIILEHFSNVDTRPEAKHYLKWMRLENDVSLLVHNTKYATAHAVAHMKTPEEQDDQQVLINHTNTLTEYTTWKLNRKIFRDKSSRDTMDEAEIICKQAR